MARKLEVTIVGDASGLSKAFGKASRSGSSFGSSMLKVGKFAAIGLAGIGAGAAVAGKKMIDMASDAAEVQSKMEVVFGKALPGLTKNIDAFSKATGTSKFAMREQAADLGALLAPLVGTKQGAADMALQFTKLATDLGSFNNVPTADALLAIRSGLVGEAEPLRRFGVLLNEAAVNAEGLRQGLIKKGETLTEQEKVQARAALIMQQTSLAQEDATRTAGSMANQMKALKTNVSDAATEIGMALLPTALKAVQAFNDHWPQIKAVAETVFGGVGDAIKKLGPVFSDIAAFAKKSWPQVKEAAKAVADWYQNELLPTIKSVIGNLKLVWEKYGADAIAVVKAQLATMRGIMNTGLALIRGDWDKAWKSFVPTVGDALNAAAKIMSLKDRVFSAIAAALGKAIVEGLGNALTSLRPKVSAKLDAIEAALRAAANDAFGWAMEIGRNIISGIVSGLSGLVGEVSSKIAGSVRSAIDAAKNLVGSTAGQYISKVMMEPMGPEMIRGFLLGTAALPAKMAEKMRDSIEAARSAIDASRGRLASAFSSLASDALSAFDAIQGEILTKSEKTLAALQAGRDKAARAAAVSDAQAGLSSAMAAVAGFAPEKDEDPAAMAARMAAAGEAVKAAQKTLDDALFAQREFALQQRAAQERKELDAKTALRRRDLEESLAALEAKMLKEGAKASTATESVLKLLGKYGVNFKDVGSSMGKAWIEGLKETLEKAAGGAGALAGTINKAAGSITVPGLKDGGTVTQTGLAMVHRGETFSGVGGGGGGGGNTYNFYGLYGDQTQVADQIVKMLERRANTGPAGTPFRTF